MSSSTVPLVAATAAAAALAAALAVLASRDRKSRKDTDRTISELEQRLRKQQQQLTEYEARLSDIRRGGAGVAALPPVHKVVLTGGPCGGKTTALTELKTRLEALGFLVLCVPEAATLLFAGGIPHPADEAAGFNFQKGLLKMQIALEDEFTAQAKASGRPCVVFFDRGLMDGKAYMTDAQWELLLDELHLTPVMMRDARYDAVLHMMTAADGAEKFYTNANNAVRLESAEEARAMDRRTLDCWTGHEHLYIVDNSSDFTEKIRRAVARVSRLVGVPVPLAVNRKFLLKKLPKTETLLQHVKRVEVFEVEQTYLATTTVAERCRIRRRQQGTNQSFQHQAWVAGADGSETLMERTLSGREYFSLMKQADPNTRAVRKTLTCFTWAHSYWELNVFQGEVEGNCILEVEAESADSRLTLPPMCEAIREVTNEPGFDSYLIAQQLARVTSVGKSMSDVIEDITKSPGGSGVPSRPETPLDSGGVRRIPSRDTALGRSPIFPN